MHTGYNIKMEFGDTAREDVNGIKLGQEIILLCRWWKLEVLNNRVFPMTL
jgi:hypothetical protein